LDTITAVYREHALVRNRMAFNGRRVELAALEGVQLLTVEMTADEFVGKGQVHAAVDHVPHGGARRVTVEGGRHHEVFTGDRFFAAVAPHLDYLMEAA
jgi:poly-beta-hydroxyalkanoate depolymerase